MDDEQEHNMELVLPFVCCISQGGPLDDHAFVAGCRFYELKQRLEIGKPDVLTSFEFPEMVPLLDLLAMDLGYKLTHFPWPEAPDEWEQVTFGPHDEVEDD